MEKKRNGSYLVHAFTMLEVVVTVIIVGVIGSLAFSGYNKILERNRCNTAQMNLKTIHFAVQIYSIKNNRSGPPLLSTLAEINSTLNLSIPEDPNFDYSTYWDPGHGPIITSGHAARTGLLTYSCFAPFYAPLSDTNPNCDNAEFCGP